MRKIILLIALTLFVSHSKAQTKHALVIGIGQYPEKSGWTKIHGDNDINIICSFLDENEFKKENIIILRNAQATKRNIIEQFGKIASISKPNDFVYVHFSGHGQQMTDLNGDEEDGFDEAWIPYDAKKMYNGNGYKGENHLVDDEINILLKDIKNQIGKNGQLVVVVDACHSGESSRGEEDIIEEVVVRGTTDKFIIPNAVKNAYKKPEPIQWVEISACKSYQSNYEYQVKGVYYGILSYSLYLYRSDLKDISLNQIEEMIAKTINERKPYRMQTIQIESPRPLLEQILFKK